MEFGDMDLGILPIYTKRSNKLNESFEGVVDYFQSIWKDNQE